MQCEYWNKSCHSSAVWNRQTLKRLRKGRRGQHDNKRMQERKEDQPRVELKNESNHWGNFIQALKDWKPKMEFCDCKLSFKALSMCKWIFYFFTCEPLLRRDWPWKMTQQERRSKFFAQMMWWHHDWQCCTLQVFLHRARIRTMSRFHTDVSREPGLNNWCWCHYSQASVYVCWWKKWPCCTGTIGQRFSLPLHALGQ